MRLILIILLLLNASVFAAPLRDTIVIPLNRQIFHDRIRLEQNQLDLLDGKQDGNVSLSSEVSNKVNTHLLLLASDSLRLSVENEKILEKNNDKVRALSYIESFLRETRLALRNRDLLWQDIPLLYNVFIRIFSAAQQGESMLETVREAPYQIAKINLAVFSDNKGYNESRNVVYLKYVTLYPDKILPTIKPYVNTSFADSLIVVACKKNPVQLYAFAQSNASIEGKLIRRNNSAMVKTVVALTTTPNALLYFPFLDNLLSGKISIDSIKQFVGNGENEYDSVGYYQLLVRTEIEYFKRMAPPLRDTPIAVFGVNGLRETLKQKALQHFITPINTLHDVSNIAVRMQAIQPLTPIDLYYMLIMGENDIYTSSYKHSFNRLLQLMGNKPRGDSLLQIVHFDYFKKFIKMAANFNRLDTFLKTMPPKSSEVLMKAFVANLDKTESLEDAVDVADSYSSITDSLLLRTIYNYVQENEERSKQEYNNRGALIYGLLKNIMLSANGSGADDLSETFGIPSIYEIPVSAFKDENGAIVQQVFFYGDEDGKRFFSAFVKAFSPKLWQVSMKDEWVEIKSLKENVWVFANRPLDSDANLDDSAQIHLNKYLADNGLLPSVIVHRGHSYWLPRTIHRMYSTAKVILIGSCGGYKNLNEILEVCSDAHIITTKEIGKGDINQPILNVLNEYFFNNKPVVWKAVWTQLTRQFSAGRNVALKESWDNYIPPYKNLGAIFIKAYNKKTEIQ